MMMTDADLNIPGHGCPGSDLPTVCCSELLSGRVDHTFARGGFTEGQSEDLSGEMSLTECFLHCQVRSEK